MVRVYENTTIVTEPAVVVYLTTSFNSNYIKKKEIKKVTPYIFFYCSIEHMVDMIENIMFTVPFYMFRFS